MARLSIGLLGSFQATLDQEDVKFRGNREQALLIYLVTERGLGTDTHRRESLMDLLWPAMPQKSAQHNLRQTIYQLRQTVPPLEGTAEDGPVSLLRADRQTVSLDPRYAIDSDIEAFVSLLGSPAEQWPKALELYRDDFLADFFLPDANTFEEWAVARREAFRRQALQALGQLAEDMLEASDGQEAERYARRQLEFDDLRESAHRQLMAALALTGERSQAIAQYGQVKELLKAELGAEPSAEIEALHQQLLSGEPLPSLRLTDASGERRSKASVPSPYRGLAAFREQDAPFFFGREGLVGQLVDAVRQRSVVHVLVGSSGSGKSSVVYAGLLPRLRADGNWLIAHARPGSQPFQAAAAGLLAILEPELSEADRLIETQKLGAALTQGDLSLDSVARRALEKNGEAARLLLVWDQFEELYTLCPDDELRRRFLDDLLAAVASSARQRTPPLVFLLTLRADFMGQALSHRPFADALQDASFMIGPMNVAELQRAIEQPAEKQGATFEEGLVERILKDVGQEPGHLPLLEFALTLLWEKQADLRLTHAAYEEIGEVEGAVARYADEVMDELTEEEGDQARQIFVQLVRPGQGTEDTRRVATRSELDEAQWSLVRHLADHRLVVTGRDEGSDQETVEVVHEALIQRWGRLRGWMATDRVFRTWQERLRAALQGWEASGLDEGALLRGGPLAEAEDWLAVKAEQMSAAEREYILASRTLRERRTAEREARRQRELAAARELAEAQRKRAEDQSRSAAAMRKRALLLAGAGAAAVILAVVAFLFGQRAIEERAAAEAQTKLAFSRELASAALDTQNLDPQLSVLLALEAVSMAETREAANALHQALQVLHIPRELSSEIGDVLDLAASPDGKLLAAAVADRVLVWDAESMVELYALPRPGTSSIAFAPDSSLAIGTAYGGTFLWDVASQRFFRSFPEPTHRAITSISFSNDGKTMATGGYDQIGKIWHVESNELPLRMRDPHAPPPSLGRDDRFSLSLDPSGKILATGGIDGKVRLFDVSTGRILSTLGEPGAGQIDALAFSPDGSRLATASNEGTVRVWRLAEDVENIDLPLLIRELAVDVAFNHDGTLLATVGTKGTTSIWDAVGGELVELLPDPASQASNVVFGTSGTHLFTSGASGKVKVWELQPGHELLTLAGSAYRDIDVSPNGKRLATTSDVVTIWDLESGRQLVALPIQEPWHVEFSPGGNEVLVAHAQHHDSNLSLWQVDSGDMLARFAFAWGSVNDVEFSPDGRQIAASRVDATSVCRTEVWDAQTGKMLSRLRAGTVCDIKLAYGPNGQMLVAVNREGQIRSRLLLSSGALDEARLADEVASSVDGLLDYQTHIGTLTSVAMSPDGGRMAIGGRSGAILVGSTTPGNDASSMVLSGHTSQIWSLDFSPDGTRLASASSDQTVRVWDVTESPTEVAAADTETSTRELLTLKAHTDTVTDVAFTPDGDRLISSSLDGTVRVSTLLLEELVALARERVTRRLTDEECQRYLHLDRCPEGE